MSDCLQLLLDSCNSTKLCKKCNSHKQLVEFSINRANKDGLQRMCKSCDNARQQVCRVEKKPEIKAWEKKYLTEKRKVFSFRLTALLNTSRQRAVLKNREHTIILQDLMDLYPVDGKCPVYGTLLEFGNSGFRENSPSIDRIDSNKGYTRSNIQIISWKANRLKSYATIDDLEILLAFMKQGG